MSAAAENAPGEAKVIPIESAPSWSSPEGPGLADRLAGAVGGALAGPLGPAATRLLGKGWEGRAAERLAFLRRRVTGDYEVDEFGFDRELTEEVLLSLLRPLAEKYFRIDVQGVENIPAEGGVLIVANHSGTIPLDALMTQVVIHDHHPNKRHLRMLAADLVFVLPGINELARKAGHTLACNEDAQALLERGEVVGVWPEGFKGIGKPFSERYKLQRFGRGGFVASALRAKVPIVPCSIVGAEETYPMVGNVKTLARLLGLPYVPITPTFPWLGPLGVCRCRPSGRSASASRSPPTGTRRRRRTIRCWSSTWPTRCGRPSSTRSTSCWCSGVRSSSDLALPARRAARRAVGRATQRGPGGYRTPPGPRSPEVSRRGSAARAAGPEPEGAPRRPDGPRPGHRVCRTAGAPAAGPRRRSARAWHR